MREYTVKENEGPLQITLYLSEPLSVDITVPICIAVPIESDSNGELFLKKIEIMYCIPSRVHIYYELLIPYSEKVW